MAKDMTVVITGAGRGLGRALVEQFLASGAHVVGITRSQKDIDSLTILHGTDRFRGFNADVRDYESICDLVRETIAATGSVDVLFNNAAVYPKINFLEESADSWRDSININLVGISNCCKAVLPHMVQRGFGRIYNLGSWADLDPIPNSSAYASSKGGVHALTRSIGADLAHLELDIEVHEWIPGHLNTRMSEFTGIDPNISANWAVSMVSTRASKKCTIFENDREWFPPKRLKERILEKVRFLAPE